MSNVADCFVSGPAAGREKKKLCLDLTVQKFHQTMLAGKTTGKEGVHTMKRKAPEMSMGPKGRSNIQNKRPK